MANHKGSEGTAKIGSNVIAEVKDWSISESAETIDDTTMGDSARTKQVSLTSASGSMTAFWDETDTSGQGAMTVGAEVTLNLYPEGATTGDTYATLSALITEKGVSTTLDGMVETSVSFEANGAVTWSTVA
jgi:hypothetical protein